MNLILGMPRSQTMWASHYLSFGERQFHHEGYASHKLPDLEAYKKLECDSTTMGRLLDEKYPLDFRKILKKSQVVLLLRRPEKVLESWAKLHKRTHGRKPSASSIDRVADSLELDYEWLCAIDRVNCDLLNSIEVDDACDYQWADTFRFIHGLLPSKTYTRRFMETKIERKDALTTFDTKWLNSHFS